LLGENDQHVSWIRSQILQSSTGEFTCRRKASLGQPSDPRRACSASPVVGRRTPAPLSPPEARRCGPAQPQ